MKLTRNGAYRNAGTSTLVEDDLTKRKGKSWRDPKWNTVSNQLTFEVRGDDRNATYDYTLSFTPSEVLKFIELGVNAFSDNTASKAVGAAALAALTELFNAKTQPQKE